MDSTRDDLVDAVFPLLKLLSMALIGLIIAHPRVQLVPKATFKTLSKLLFMLFLPCLIFNNLAQSISLKNLLLWWFIPVNIVVSTAIGCILGYLVTLFCRPPPQFFRFTIIMTAFGNTGYIPLAVVSSVCHSSDNPFGPSCYASGVAYVSFTQWVCIILVYTLVYHMMEPPLEYYEIVEEKQDDDDDDELEGINEIVEEISVNDLSRPLLVEAEWPGMEDKEIEHCKTPFIAKLFNSISSMSQIPDLHSMEEGHSHPNSPKSIKCLAEPRMVRKIRIVAEHTPIRNILQPPMLASVLAILVGIIPRLSPIAFGDDAPLSFITDSLDIMAAAAVPSAMLILGGMVAEGPNESKLGLRTTIGIIVARLLILPLAGIGVIFLADKWDLLIPGDQLYRFVLLLQYTTPSALLLGAIASLRGYAVEYPILNISSLMGDHFVLLVDRLLTESTIEAAIESRNRLLNATTLTNMEEVASQRTEKGVGSSPTKLVECRICHDEDEDSNMEIPCSCCGSLKYAHRKCVQRWCNEKGDTICEICLEQYRPDYTAPPPLFRYGGAFRGHWEILRRDLHNPQFTAMVTADREFLDSGFDEYPAPSFGSLMCCRIVAIIFMVLLIFRHTLPIITSEVGEYSMTLLMLLTLRTIGILLPIYIIVKACTAIQTRRRQQDPRFSLASSDEENELPTQQHTLSRFIYVR
ncbi:hypothetical protein LWI28_025952 [Acer negundo]|uniref:RING-CH-type domain-containing protein n=1 Tax=Acer negundo TaxID=4023 RepID=A0AAD5IH95_ACENE|nr:hypothetical protein LWI28_025952 [Acer negundo]